MHDGDIPFSLPPARNFRPGKRHFEIFLLAHLPSTIPEPRAGVLNDVQASRAQGATRCGKHREKPTVVGQGFLKFGCWGVLPLAADGCQASA
jgi:hypothetical protein